jgi:D-aminoacyl-tRNA deacylase
MGVLLVASKSDTASMTLYAAMMRLDGWSKPFSITSGDYYIHECGSVYLLVIDQIHIRADHIDLLFKKQTGLSVYDILILSRHVSRSNTPAMTLHAIGIPGILPYGEEGISGGKNGLLVPPSKYFASLFRRMNTLARKKKLDDDFDLTLETTHHGPILTTPTLYIEIGSTEDEWGREDVADCWAEVISDVLVMFGSKSVYFNSDLDVMIGFGGGHYAPRHKAVILNSDINVGHIIANYSLIFEQNNESEIPSGPWSECIQSAVDSTRISFPQSKIFAHLDRKSFKGWQRSAIIQKLDDLGVEVRRAKQISQRE